MFNRKLFEAYVLTSGKSMKAVAKALGMNATTLYRKLDDNGRFTRNEIYLFCEYLNISPEAMVTIFFANEVA